jgi:hypothetical protein
LKPILTAYFYTKGLICLEIREYLGIFLVYLDVVLLYKLYDWITVQKNFKFPTADPFLSSDPNILENELVTRVARYFTNVHIIKNDTGLFIFFGALYFLTPEILKTRSLSRLGLLVKVF